jgi:hypothetical protein
MISKCNEFPVSRFRFRVEIGTVNRKEHKDHKESCLLLFALFAKNIDTLPIDISILVMYTFIHETD